MITHRFLLSVLFTSLAATEARADDCLAANQGGEEQWVCTFATTKSSQANKNKERPGATSKYETLLTLAPSYFAFRVADKSTVADLPTETIYYLSRTEEQCVAVSFFGWADFRVMEFMNCTGLEAAKKAMGLPTASTFDLETFYGVQVPPKGQPKAVNANPAKDGWNFVHEGHAVAGFVRSSHNLPAPLRLSWNIFLAHFSRLHPEIRKVVSEEPSLPQRLRFSYADNDDAGTHVTEEYELLLVRIEPVGTIADLIKGKRVVPTEDQRLSRLLENLATTKVPKKEETLKLTEEAVKTDLRAGHLMDALLAALEYFHQTGDRSGAQSLMADLRPKVMTDPLVRRYFSGKGGSAELSGIRESARANNCRRLNVLDYLVADAALEEGVPTARDCLFSILEQDPLQCGALIDLGRTYTSEYNTFGADLCYQAARQMYPGHSALNDIDAAERRVRADFPDFFAPQKRVEEGSRSAP